MKYEQLYKPSVVCDTANKLDTHASGAALVFLDPPYNQGMKYNDDPTGDSLPTDEYLEMLECDFMSAYRALRPGGVVAVLISTSWAIETGLLLNKVFDNQLNWIIWHERFSQYTDKKFAPSHRNLFIYQKTGTSSVWNTEHIRVPSERMKMGDKRAKGPRVPSDVWSVRRLQGTSHDRIVGFPCQLPPEPLERLVHAYTNPGDLVAEQFVGVGSLTRVVARMGRKYIGVEQSEQSCKIAAERGEHAYLLANARKESA